MEQYQDFLDWLEYPESPSLDDNDYEPGDDDDDGDNEGIDGNEGVHSHNLNEVPTCVRSVNSHKHPRLDSLDSNNGPLLYFSGRRVLSASNTPAPYHQIASLWKRLHSVHIGHRSSGQQVGRLAGNN